MYPFRKYGYFISAYMKGKLHMKDILAEQHTNMKCDSLKHLINESILYLICHYPEIIISGRY
jgi:hypothetical protein